MRGERIVVVWQDMREDHQSLRYAVSDDAGATLASDLPAFPGAGDGIDRYGPEVIWIDDAHALLAYETTASGGRRVALRLLSL